MSDPLTVALLTCAGLVLASALVFWGWGHCLVWWMTRDQADLRQPPPPPKPRLAFLHGVAVALFVLFGVPHGVMRAQEVTIRNLTGDAFSGWKRVTTDRLPAAPSGVVDGVQYVVGEKVGLSTWAVDVRGLILPGQTFVLDLERAMPLDFELGGLPSDPAGFFGSLPSVNGVGMGLVSLRPDGAAWSAHFRARHGRMFATDLWLRWYPDQPGWVPAEVLTTCSNPLVPDLTETAPAGVAVSFGDAWAVTLGGGLPVPAGTVFADGQARPAVVTFIWPRHLRDASEWSSAGCAAGLAVAGCGIERLLHDGNPILPLDFSPSMHVRTLWAESVRRLGTWDDAMLGFQRNGSATGAQSDQIFVGGEVFAGVGCELLTYLGALKAANRPCHHLEADGSPLDGARHVSPRLVIWQGRPHWHEGVSPDRLGKPRAPSLEETAGWINSDTEHRLFNTLAAAVRLTGSPLCQHLLAVQARLYMLELTTQPGWSTSWCFASRSIGYEGMIAVHCWRDLQDRTLAAQVRDHFRRRWETILKPALAGRPFWYDGFYDTGRWCPWQQALGAYGLDLAGRVFGIGEARAAALEGARAVLEHGFVQREGRWVTHSTLMLQSRAPETGSSNIFYLFGMPCAVAVVLRSDPEDARARAIWAQMGVDARLPGQVSWMDPGVPNVFAPASPVSGEVR